ncbi:MAG TPA: ribosome maturation factor RimM [Gemmatimonadaceae bacterium]|nr:ribosome maturation factor RimM [Gemmatimonadaceae bacterium]
MPDAPAHLIVGRVRRAHGLRGDIVVEVLTDAPDAIFAPGRRVIGGTTDGELGEATPLEIESASPFKDGLLITRVRGIGDRDSAEQWRDRYLLVPGDEAEPPGESEAYLHELVGMRVDLADGTPLGQVLDYYELPQGLMVEVDRNGKRTAIPLISAFLRDIDRDERRIVVELPDGMLD